MLRLQGVRQAGEVVAGERREPSPDRQAVAAEAAGESELAAAGDRAAERGVAAEAGAQAERAGALGDVELEAFRFGLEADREAAEEPGAGRADHAEPEALDVLGAGVVPDPVDDGVGPRNQGEVGGGERRVGALDRGAVVRAFRHRCFLVVVNGSG